MIINGDSFEIQGNFLEKRPIGNLFIKIERHSE